MADERQSWIFAVRERLASPPPRRLAANDLRQAAVLVPLYVDAGELWTVLTQRTEDLPSHRGQIAFPGGSRELKEDPWGAALRESQEEIGLDPKVVLRLGELDEQESSTGFRVVPCVGAIPHALKFKPNEGVKVSRNPDYWKKDRPHLDGIEYTIIKNASTRVLAFIAGKFDMTTPYNLTIPLMRDIQNQAPQAICVLTPTNVSRTLIVNRSKPPFDDPAIRRALALSLDRKAFIDTLNEGKADIGGAMLPPPEGLWTVRRVERAR